MAYFNFNKDDVCEVVDFKSDCVVRLVKVSKINGSDLRTDDGLIWETNRVPKDVSLSHLRLRSHHPSRDSKQAPDLLSAAKKALEALESLTLDEDPYGGSEGTTAREELREAIAEHERNRQ